MTQLRTNNGSVTFWLKVKPRSSREGLRLDSSGQLQLELHAAPTEGQANQACVRFLARVLDLPQASVEIVSGQRARRKLIRVTSPLAQDVTAKLDSLARK